MNRRPDTGEQRDVFLSYASEDANIAEAVNYALCGIGYSVFFDKKDLPFAGDYHSRLREAVANAKLFVFLVSADSITQRKYARTELKYARDRWGHPKGVVLPVVVRPVALSAVPNYLKAVTFLEPEGDIAAEVAAAVSVLLPKSSALAPSGTKKLPIREPRDPTPFLGYLRQEMIIMLGLMGVSLLLALAGAIINRYYAAVWSVGWLHVLLGSAIAVIAAACFFGQMSHLSWLGGQIQLSRVLTDATEDDVNENLLAIDKQDAWVRYRLGLAALTASAIAYGYAIVMTVVPLHAAFWQAFWIVLAAAVVTMTAHYYLSTRYPYADAPFREWLDRL